MVVNGILFGVMTPLMDSMQHSGLIKCTYPKTTSSSLLKALQQHTIQRRSPAKTNITRKLIFRVNTSLFCSTTITLVCGQMRTGCTLSLVDNSSSSSSAFPKPCSDVQSCSHQEICCPSKGRRRSPKFLV